MALVLGYQGRFTTSDPQLLENIRELARLQIKSWAMERAEKRVRIKMKRKWLGNWWRDYGWCLSHLLLPLAILVMLVLKRTSIINSLPF
jgi:hypothetical protein